MAPLQKDTDRELRGLIAKVIYWQGILERLVELKQQTAGSDDDAVPAVAKPDWQQLATNARQYAVEFSDPGSKQALIELAESYDKLAQRDAALGC